MKADARMTNTCTNGGAFFVLRHFNFLRPSSVEHSSFFFSLVKRGKSVTETRSTSQQSRCIRLICQGWISLAAWIVFGLLIEGLIGFRSPALLDDSVRREMFRLAHAHGTLLNLVLIAAAVCAR